MIFRRKIYDKLLIWKKESQGTKALLIEGARRIGKSTIVSESPETSTSHIFLSTLITSVRWLLNCFEKKEPLEPQLHHKAMLLFRQFMLVGGMPKVLDLYITSARNFDKSDAEKRDILNLYRNDIMKIGTKYRSKVLSIFDAVPGFLSQHEKRIVFNEIGSGSFFTQYADTFFWLADSKIVNECFKCNDPNVGLSLNEDRSYVKCYMGDTGLLVSHAFNENEITENELYKQVLNDKLSLNEGMLCMKMRFHRFLLQTDINCFSTHTITGICIRTTSKLILFFPIRAGQSIE